MSEHEEKDVFHRLMGLYFVTYEYKDNVAWGIGTTQEESVKDARMFIEFDHCAALGISVDDMTEETHAFADSVLHDCSTEPCTKEVLQYIGAYGGDRFLKVAYRDKQGIWRIKQV